MTVEEISNRIIDENYLLRFREGVYVCDRDGYDLSHADNLDEENTIAHYGVLGMKWGIRKDRQRKGESDQQYKERMERQSRERIAAADRKAREKEQKRTLRSQERIQKAQIRSNERKDKALRKSQEKSQAAQRKAQEKQQVAQRKAQQKQQEKDNKRTKSDINKNKKEPSTRSMSDAELRDAINRMKAEREYAQLSKKPDSASVKAAKGVGKLAMKVGSSILVTQLTKVGTKKISKILGTDDDDSKSKDKAKKAKTTTEKAVNTAADVVNAVNKVSKTMSSNSDKLDFDAFNAVWKTSVYYDDRRKG